MARSEEKTDWTGKKYTQHYDDSGNKSGRSEEKTSWSGDRYTQNYDQSGNKSGYSENKTAWSGSPYTQHHNRSGDNSGWSSSETAWSGDHYTQHRDQSGTKTGWSEKKTNWAGQRYTKHHDIGQFGEGPSSDNATTASSSSGDGSLTSDYSDIADYSYSASSSSDDESGGLFKVIGFIVVAVIVVGLITKIPDSGGGTVVPVPAAPVMSPANPTSDESSRQPTAPPIDQQTAPPTDSVGDDADRSDATTPAEAPVNSSEQEVVAATAIGVHDCSAKYDNFKATFGNRTGDVTIQYTIRADGSVADLETIESSGITALDQLAESCVRGWSFSPAQQNGIAVESSGSTPFQFQ